MAPGSSTWLRYVGVCAGVLLPAALIVPGDPSDARAEGLTRTLEGGEGYGPIPSQFFRQDPEWMDELPPINMSTQCHPKCTWKCDSSAGATCDTSCSPLCQPPKCVTTCKPVVLSKCKSVCQEPQCAVVCPHQCAHGRCPKCKAVCNKPACILDCGQTRSCESKCANPLCAWRCEPNKSCPSPNCRLVCDGAKICGFGGNGVNSKLPDEHTAAQVGGSIAWTGFAKVSADALNSFKPTPPDPTQQATTQPPTP